MLGFGVYLATRFPAIFAGFKRFWKPVLAAVVVGAALWGFVTWRDNLINASRLEGRAIAEKEYSALVTAANKRAASDQSRLDQMVKVIGSLSTQREQAIAVKVSPIIESVTREASSDPLYRNCAVSDGMRDKINAARSAVDTGIGASAPR